MGNILCKSNNTSQRSPFEYLPSINCPNVCPVPKKRNNYWKKNVITSTNMKGNKWENASTLISTQPLAMNQKIIKDHPVPPPRKKKISLQKSASTEYIPPPKDGFQILFGSIGEDMSNNRNSQSENMLNAPMAQKRLKVGNRKTDRFFGENLSDSLSDEPPEDVTNNNNNTTNKEVENDKRKTAFLLTMLNNYQEEDMYRGMKPAEEPEITKVVKVRRCICDGDEQNHVHSNGGPKKPQRDIELYRKSQTPKTPSPPVRRKKSETPQLKDEVVEETKEPLSFENSPLHPTKIEKIETEKVAKFDTSTPKQKLSMPNLSEEPKVLGHKIKPHNRVLKKSYSTHSFLSNDVMDALIKRNYGLDYGIIEELGLSSKVDDGSSFVSNNITKLATRKVSSHKSSAESLSSQENRKVDTANSSGAEHKESTIKEENSSDTAKVLTASKSDTKTTSVPVASINLESRAEETTILEEKVIETEKSRNLCETKVIDKVDNKESESPTKEEKIIAKEAKDESDAPSKPPRRSSKTNIDLEKVVSSNPSKEVRNVVGDIYDNQKEIVLEFQKFLEEELQKSPSLFQMYAKGNEREMLARDVQEVIRRTEEELAKANSTQDYNMTPVTPIIKIQAIDDAHENKSSGSVPSSSSDSAPSVVEVESNDDSDDVEDIDYKGRGRHESIVDIDPWFFQHCDTTTRDIPKEVVDDVTPGINYDHKKLFPFGDVGEARKRHDSLNAEFFDSDLLDTTEHVKNDAEKSADEKIHERDSKK